MLQIENLEIKIGNFRLSDISLRIETNDYFVLLGPTGSGKTTLLKGILGLHKQSGGSIALNSRSLHHLPVMDRNIGYLPQNYLLFPTMNVFENISYGLRLRNHPDITSAVGEIAETLNIASLLDRSVQNLSGGESQRVALARALVIKPDLVLMDEPFAAIDNALKTQLWFEIKQILKQFHIPVIHITHNLDEAYALADRLGVLLEGTLQQVGNAEEIFTRPASVALARFLGMTNIFPGTARTESNNRMFVDLGKLKITLPGTKVSGPVQVCIPSEAIKIIKQGFPVRPELADNVFSAEVVSTYFFFDTCIMNLSVNGLALVARFPIHIYKRYALTGQRNIDIGLWQPGILLFDRDTGSLF